MLSVIECYKMLMNYITSTYILHDVQWSDFWYRGGDGATGCPGMSDFQADKDKLIEELLKMVQR